MPTVYDYAALRTQFISTEPPISISELCRRNDIVASKESSIQRMAKLEEWVELRDKRMARTDEKVIEQISAREAKRRLRRIEVEDNAVEAIDEAITKMRDDMKRLKKVQDPETREWSLEPAVTYRPEQVVQLMDRIKGIFGGGPPELDQDKSGVPQIGLNFNFDGTNPEHRALAAGIIEHTRGGPESPSTRPTTGSPLPHAPGASSD